MSHIKILPWKGKDYDTSSFGKKILIVGESHYNGENQLLRDDEIRNFTINTIGEISNSVWTHAYFTKIAASFIGNNPDQDMKKKFWNSISFCNFVQVIFSGPRIQPSEDEYNNSLSAFSEILTDLKPQLLVILSYGTWNHIQNITEIKISKKEKVFIEGKYVEPFSIKFENLTCLVLVLPHPSTKEWGSVSWYSFIKKLIEMA